jgi:hypothetical protein
MLSQRADRNAKEEAVDLGTRPTAEGDPSAFGLELPDDLHLLLRQDLRADLMDAELGGHALGGGAVVAGE